MLVSARWQAEIGHLDTLAVVIAALAVLGSAL
jgi:hypothetical protein